MSGAAGEQHPIMLMDEDDDTEYEELSDTDDNEPDLSNIKDDMMLAELQEGADPGLDQWDPQCAVDECDYRVKEFTRFCLHSESVGGMFSTRDDWYKEQVDIIKADFYENDQDEE